MRVAKKGERDDERVIELREGGEEQVIQAQLKAVRGSQPSPSEGTGSSSAASSVLPGIVSCNKCGSRFAEGVQFCGRCGNREFTQVKHEEENAQFSCPRCLTNLPSNTKFCGKCGLSITSETGIRSTPGGIAGYSQNTTPSLQKTCPKCRAQYGSNVRFCGRCGTTI